jgi:hypothetical protein
MVKDILETKKAISRAYLGKHRIHGVGLDSARNQIVIYREDNRKDSVLDEIVEAAKPFDVRIEVSEAATTTGNS